MEPPDQVEWTHEGFTATVSHLDDLAGDRNTLAVGVGMGGIGAAGLGYLGFLASNDLGVALATGLFGLVFVGLTTAMLTVSASKAQQKLMLREVGVDATRIWWNQSTTRLVLHGGESNSSVPLGDVTGLRVAGPRPWRLLIETEAKTHRIDCGNEGDARWLAEAIAGQIRKHRGKGDERAVPRNLQRLTE